MASWVWAHEHAQKKVNDRANNKHALETYFVAAGKLRIITAITYFRIRENARTNESCAKLALDRLRCRELGQVEFLAHFHEICYRIGLHFLHHLASVCLHCFLADTELATHLLI